VQIAKLAAQFGPVLLARLRVWLERRADLGWVRKLALYFVQLHCSCHGVEVGEVGAEETNRKEVEEVYQMPSVADAEP
jgi:hypothetical protein